MKKEIKLTNLNKIFWPEEKYTKGDLIKYYEKIAPIMLPHIKDRPQSLNRFPNGIKGSSFFQKDMDHLPPSWAKTKKIHSESNDKDINYLIANDKETLVYLANLGCIEINVWNSRLGNLDYPDFLVIDLDPVEIDFDAVIDVALEAKKILDNLGIKSFVKTSGSRGMHLYVPTGAIYSYHQVENFAHILAILVNRKIPDITSLERLPKNRKKKVYIDYLQNGKGKTMAAPYSLRPKPGAPVSTPLLWSELKKGFDPKKFNIKTIFVRLKKKGDVWEDIYKNKFDLEKAIKTIEVKPL